MSRLEGAILSVREAVAAASSKKIPLEAIGEDDDIVETIGLKHYDLISLSLIIEEIFSIAVPEDLFDKALYRTASGLAEWAIRQSQSASFQEAQRQARRA